MRLRCAGSLRGGDAGVVADAHAHGMIAAAIPLQAGDGVVDGYHAASVRRMRLDEESTPGWGDVFDMPSLRYLGQSLELPLDRWPKVDLQVAVESTHRSALPGDVVTFTIRVRNAGRANLERAEVNVLLSLCCPEAEVGTSGSREFGRVTPRPSRSQRRCEYQSSSVTVTAYPFDPLGQDSTDDNTAVMWIAGEADPDTSGAGTPRRSATLPAFRYTSDDQAPFSRWRFLRSSPLAALVSRRSGRSMTARWTRSRFLSFPCCRMMATSGRFLPMCARRLPSTSTTRCRR